MKNLLTILFFFICTIAYSGNYYVKATGNNSNTGLSDAQAWQSIGKVNSAALVTGDVVQFRSGDVFAGTIIPQANGIVYTSYNAGNKPIITGFTTISSWTSLPGNLYEATVTGGLSTLSMVVINGIPTPMGRYPNANAANSGYLNYEAVQLYTSITDNELAATPNYTGADVVIRTSPYATRRTNITSHVGTKITFPGIPGVSAFQVGMGYFFENSLLTLDQTGEWYYNPATQKITIYYTTTPPSIQVSTVNNLVNINNRQNCTFNGLSFTGSEQTAIYMSAANNTLINNCDFQYIGESGIWYQRVVGLTVQGCKFRDINVNGILEPGGLLTSNIIVRNNTFRYIGMQPGMVTKSTLYGESVLFSAVSFYCPTVTVEYNTFDSIGYTAIAIRKNGENHVVRRNIISNYCGSKSDGGAIYNAGLRGFPVHVVPTIIEENFVSKTLNSTNGTTHPSTTNLQTDGIYLDATSTNVIVRNNTVDQAWKGIFIVQCQNIVVTGNTIYNSGEGAAKIGMMYVADRDLSFQRTINNRITNNIFFSRITTQLPYGEDMLIGPHPPAAPPYDVEDIGILDSNYYINTGDQTKLFTWNYGPNNLQYSFNAWRTAFPSFDAHSHTTPIVTPVLTNANADQYLTFHTNAADTIRVIDLRDSIKYDGKGTRYVGQITMPIWSSIVLIDSGFVQTVTPPTANAGVDKSITLPTTNTSVTGTGTNGSGTSRTYLWSQISGPSVATITTPTSATTTITALSTAGTYTFKLKVTNNLGDTAIDFMQVVVNPANIAPTANAGTDQGITLPTSSTTLVGSGTDPDGTIVAYLWTKISGPSGGAITSSTNATTGITGLQQGTYVYSLRVTDNDGATGTDLVQITVNPANVSPTANAGADQGVTLPTSTATLTGSGTDPDGTITAYLWTKISGPSGGTITSSTSATTGITGLQQGTYVYSLMVTDDDGATGNDFVQIVVSPAPIAPTANAGTDQSVTLPTSTTTLVGSGTDPDGTIVSYAWLKISGPAGGTITSPTSATTGITALQEGTYVYRLTVTDNQSLTGVDFVQVVVNPAVPPVNVPPVAVAGADQFIQLPTSTTSVNGSGSSDPDGTITGYLWRKLSGPSGGAISTPTTVSTNITGLIAGTYIYQLRVTDNSGDTATDAIQITVNAANIAPTVDAGANQVITLPTSSTNLTGTATDPDGSISGVVWTKISGPTGGAISSHTSLSTAITGMVAGVYVYQLTATDNSGDTASDAVQITVNAANIAPNVDAGINQIITLPTSTTTLTGTATDPDGSIASVLWTKISGPAGGSITSPTSLSTGITALGAGVYVFQLTATDNSGDTASDAVQVTVNAANLPPVAVAGADQTITLPTSSAALNGNGSYDPDGTIVSYEWRQLSGVSTATIGTPNSVTTTVSGLQQGSYIFQLKVVDNTGDSAVDAIQITVNAEPVNVPPVADAGIDQTIFLPQDTVRLTGNGIDLDGSIVSYAWTGTFGIIVSPNSASTQVTGLWVGTHTYTLTVTDNRGDTATSDVIITVLPQPISQPVLLRGYRIN